MRVHIHNDNEAVMRLVSAYLQDLLLDRRVDLIINGAKTTGIIESFQLDMADFACFSVRIEGVTKQIPLLTETKARMGKELVVLETQSHTTVIELLD